MNQGMCAKIIITNKNWQGSSLNFLYYFLFLTIVISTSGFADQLSYSPASHNPASNNQDAGKYQSLDSLFELYQPYLGNIAAYEPMYFLVGTDPEKSKFQFSFKYRFFNPKGPISQKYPWVNGFHFAFTQLAFWDLKSSSAPFADTSYKPELFFLSPNLIQNRTPFFRFFLHTGIRHESNGKDGLDSRSTNYWYFKPILIFYQPTTQWGIQCAPKLWAYVADNSDNNNDLIDYRGFWNLSLKIGKADNIVVETQFSWAKRGGSFRFDTTYPLHQLLLSNLDLYLQFEYTNSLGENLLNYSDRIEAYRFGFAIIR